MTKALLIVGTWVIAIVALALVLMFAATANARVTVSADRLNLYDDIVAVTVRVDVKVAKPTTAVVWANGTQHIDRPDTPGWWIAGQGVGEQVKVKLKPGRNTFGRTLFVRYYFHPEPGYGAALGPYHHRLVRGGIDGADVEVMYGQRTIQLRAQ